MQQTETRLAAIGLGQLNQRELEMLYHSLCKRIDIGLHRSGSPTQEDGGLLAIRTGIPVLTHALWQKVPSGSEALVCAFGGTNWIIGHVRKDEDGSICIAELSKYQIAVTERCKTFQDFVQLMADLLLSTSKEHKLTYISTLGISLGFAHISERVSYGIEGILTSSHLSKGWQLSNWDPQEDKYLGKALMQILNASGELHIEQIAMLNDTCAVALDFGTVTSYVQQGCDILPVGIVYGTGTNACIGDRAELVNLEIGEAPYEQEILNDPTIEAMVTRNIVPFPPILEYYTGGFLPLRLAMALQLLDEQGVLPQGKALGDAVQHADGTLLSILAAGKVNIEALRNSWHVPVEEASLPILQLAAQRVLQKAGQVYGVILAAVIQQVRKEQSLASQEAVVRVEGSVIHEGYQIKEVVRRMCEQLELTNVHIVKSSGLAGAGSLAMSLKLLRG